MIDLFHAYRKNGNLNIGLHKWEDLPVTAGEPVSPYMNDVYERRICLKCERIHVQRLFSSDWEKVPHDEDYLKKLKNHLSERNKN